MKSNKNKVEIYIIKGKSNRPLPYQIGYHKHSNEYVENYKINKKINANNIEIYTKGLEDEDFEQIKLFNQ